MPINKEEIDKFFKTLSDTKLLQINRDFAKNKFDGVIKTINQILINEYGVDSIYTTTIIRNSVNEILSSRYSKLKSKLKNRKNGPKKS